MAEDEQGEEQEQAEGAEEEGSGEPQGEQEESEPSGKGKGDLERWKRESRKWEGRAKTTAKELEDLRVKLAEREDADKSEHERAVEAAARQAREEAMSEAEKERRTDRLELAVVKVASVTGVDVDGKAAKFSDPDDVQMWLEKQMARGEIDPDDIYKDGKVDEQNLAGELARLAAAKPGWLVGAKNGSPAGSADGGRGAAPAGSSVEGELAAIQRARRPVKI